MKNLYYQIGKIALIAVLLGAYPVKAADKKADELHMKAEDMPSDLKVVNDIIYKQV